MTFIFSLISTLFVEIHHSLVTQLVKNLSAMWKTWVQSLAWEDSLEEGMATHFSILAWGIPMDRGAWLQPMGSQRLDMTD